MRQLFSLFKMDYRSNISIPHYLDLSMSSNILILLMERIKNVVIWMIGFSYLIEVLILELVYRRIRVTDKPTSVLLYYMCSLKQTRNNFNRSSILEFPGVIWLLNPLSTSKHQDRYLNRKNLLLSRYVISQKYELYGVICIYLCNVF